MVIRRKKTKVIPSRRWMIISVILLALIAGSAAYTYKYYKWTFYPNVELSGRNEHFIYIPDKSDFETVIELLKREKVIKEIHSFIWLSNFKGYSESVKGGRYKIVNGMSNNQLVNMLRSGNQSPVKLTFHNIRTRNDFAGIIGQKIEADSAALLNLLNDNHYLSNFHLNTDNALVLFIPNTYEFFWNTKPDGFFRRMKREYDTFWNMERSRKADSLGLTQIEVSILASIVDEETIKEKEKTIVAGLYLNRLKKGIRLQADPTVKFANGNFHVNRVLSSDLDIDSPYNTYKYAGLPPGPIRIPSISGIDAVLNADNHSYLYMCAKEDFSGYHNFATTLAQHNRNAAKYRQALRERKIWR